jgi:hypothetical protein
MARKTALADLDIVSEALSQQDGLAERIARARGQRVEQVLVDTPAPHSAESSPTDNVAAEQKNEAVPIGPIRRGRTSKDPNAWRVGKALLQVAIPIDAHIELAVLAKRRRIAVSDLVRSAMNEWLEKHGHALRITE